jgi:hypothetical protein
MTSKEYKLRKKLLEEFLEAKDLELRAREAYEKIRMSLDDVARNLMSRQSTRLKAEEKLKNWEWKHGKDSPECTGTEY